ncbi:50S ribosomal protein L10 [candidate division KSB1 bacterium]|nr:50S ribosomal protein L10 [candidate division KSB1 bacterium]
MARPDKEQIVADLTERLKVAKSLLLTDFTGLNVEEISALRTQLREAEVEYTIVKNTLARLSVEQLGISQLLKHLQGPTAIALGLNDPIAPAKVITEFSKKKDKPTLKAYYLDGDVYEGSQIDDLAKLPGREVLLGQVVGTIAAPLTGFVTALQNLLQQLVVALNEIKKLKEQ